MADRGPDRLMAAGAGFEIAIPFICMTERPEAPQPGPRTDGGEL